ncbi:MAG: MlaD family protein, partial [Alphaproteobacteria bacterium]
MEIRARYILMGLFTLGAVLAVFGFIFWMHSTGGFQEKERYRIKVESSVSGLLKGAAVLFNGIRVGEVTDLQLNPEHPREVMVWVAVAEGTPVRADTRIDVD